MDLHPAHPPAPRLNADAHYRNLVPAATCPHCTTGADETREHYLLDCPCWGHERAELWLEVAQLEIRGLQLPCSAAVLLGSTAATRNRSQLEGLARATGRFLTRTGRLRQ